MPVNPIINEAVLVRGPRPLEGDIELGEVFAWEPDIASARELLIVARIEDIPVTGKRRIYSWDLGYTKMVWNDENSFREAVVRTRFQRLATSPPPPVHSHQALDDYRRRYPAIARVWNDKSGVTAVEYCLIAALIGVVIVGSLGLVGTSLKGKFSSIATTISSASK